MAEQETGPVTNGSGDSGTDGNGGQPQISILAQYVKDLSVENPSSPQVFQWQDQASLDVQFNIQVDQFAEDVHEVVLKIDVSARSAQGVHFVVDLSYGGLFSLRNAPEEALGPFMLIEAPRLLFPFARQVVAEAVASAGFPPLLLDPIDFGGAYMAQLQAAQEAAGKAEGEEGAENPETADTPTDA
jgi:preprotein translocase subunit SecB